MESKQFTLDLGPEYASTSRKSYRYTTEDWQILINVLRRYSDELKSLSQQLSMTKSRESNPLKYPARKKVIFGTIWMVASFAFSLLIFVISLFVHFADEFVVPAMSKITITSDGINKFLWTSSGLTFVSALVLVIIGGYEYLDPLKESAMERRDLFHVELLEKDARVMSNRLESAVRLTIMASDQLEISLAKKLEMDLLTDEAISALEYYHSIAGDEKKAYKFAKL